MERRLTLKEWRWLVTDNIASWRRYGYGWPKTLWFTLWTFLRFRPKISTDGRVVYGVVYDRRWR